MAATTTQAILEDLRDLIDGLDPRGEAYGNGEYTTIPSWPSMPEADLDRRFCVHDMVRGIPQNFGSPDEYDYDGTIRVSIGHSVLDDENQGGIRRDTDNMQIEEELEKSANFPDGMSLIRFMDQTIEREDDNHWRSTLVFEIHFSIAAP